MGKKEMTLFESILGLGIAILTVVLMIALWPVTLLCAFLRILQKD